MTYVTLPRLMIAGLRAQSGQNEVYRAILGAFRRRNIAVQTWIAGPDSSWSALHNHLTGGRTRTLDSWLLSPEMMQYLLQRHGGSPAISLIHAPNGFYEGEVDGYAAVPHGSAAELAEILNLPVVLVLDAKDISFTGIPLLRGMQEYADENRFVGYIVVEAVPELIERWQPLIYEASGLPCLGYLPKGDTNAHNKDQRPVWEAGAWVNDFNEETTLLADHAERYIDLNGIADLAGRAKPTLMAAPSSFMKLMAETAQNEPFRLGVAQDVAFHDYNQNNLDLLVDMGAQLVFFSPLRNRMLPPDLDGLYFGGGHPEMVAGELEANSPLRERIVRAVQRGVPLLAEAEGVYYLAQQLENPHHRFFNMLGLIPGKAVLHNSELPPDYCELTPRLDGLLGLARQQLRGVLNYRLRLTEAGDAFRIRKPGGETYFSGYISDTVCASVPKLFFHSNPELAAAFSRTCAEHAVLRRNGKVDSLDIWPV